VKRSFPLAAQVGHRATFVHYALFENSKSGMFCGSIVHYGQSSLRFDLSKRRTLVLQKCGPCVLIHCVGYRNIQCSYKHALMSA
jgi:hypothetical protein